MKIVRGKRGQILVQQHFRAGKSERQAKDVSPSTGFELLFKKAELIRINQSFFIKIKLSAANPE